MGDWRQLSEAADELEGLHRRLGEIVEQEEDGWQLELVRVRRLLSDLVARIATLLDKGTGELSSSDRLDLRQKFASFRSVLATHQSSCSAVAVGEDGRAYRESAAAMLKAGVAFLQ
jgi:hypothetical protein